MLVRGVEQIERAGQVDVVVKPGIFDRDAHARHRRQVCDCRELLLGKQTTHEGPVADVAFDESEAGGTTGRGAHLV